MKRIVVWLWLIPYWAAFTWLVVDGGRRPGLVLNRGSISYPLEAVSGEVALIAGLVLWMARLFYRAPAHRVARWVESAGFVGVLLFLALPILATDLPGHVYAVAFFALVSVVVFAVRAVSLAAVPRD